MLLFSSRIRKQHDSRLTTVTVITGVITTLVLATMFLLEFRPTERLNYIFYDALTTFSERNPETGKVVIVDIDEKSLEKFGQWPWPRYIFAELIDRIREHRPAAVGIDILFPEPDRTSPLLLANVLGEYHDRPVTISGIPDRLGNHDQLLADALSMGPFGLAHQFLFDQRSRVAGDCVLKALSAAVTYSEKNNGAIVTPPAALGSLCSIRMLSESASYSGFVNISPDLDGVIRRTPLVVPYRNQWYPSLGLATYLEAVDNHSALITVSNRALRQVRLSGNTVPLDKYSNMMINYRGGKGSFDTVSSVDLLEGRVAPELLTDRIVLVGTTAIGVESRVTTPVDRHLPAIEVQATIVDNLFGGDYLRPLQFSTLIDIILVMLAGIVATLLMALVQPWLAVSLLLMYAGVAVAGSFWLFSSQNIVLLPTATLITIAVVTSILALLRYWWEEQIIEKQRIQLARSREAIIISLASLAESRDPQMAEQFLRVQLYVKTLAEYMSRHGIYQDELTHENIDKMVTMSLVHDIGKFGMRDDILLKPGPLTPEEFEEVKLHPIISMQVLSAGMVGLEEEDYLSSAIDMAYCHHEKWNGCGYPRGLAGLQIPLSARIMAVVDVYDAMLTARAHKSALTHDNAVELIIKDSGISFDPQIVRAFAKISERFRQISEPGTEQNDQPTFQQL